MRPQLHPYITPVGPECCSKSNQSGFILFQEVSHCKNRQKQPFMDTSVASRAWNCRATVKRFQAFAEVWQQFCRGCTASDPAQHKKDFRTFSQLHFLLLLFLTLWSFFRANTLFQHPANIAVLKRESMRINKKYQTLSLKWAKLPTLNRMQFFLRI